MNFMVNKELGATSSEALDMMDAQRKQRSATLERLMKAWESKAAQNAKRAGGLGMVAVTLAACGGSSSPNSGGNPNSPGNGEPTTPIEPTDANQRFFVLDFPTQTVNKQSIAIDGGAISIEAALAAFVQLADAQLVDGGNITIENINIVQDALIEQQVRDDAVVNVVTIGGNSVEQMSFADFIELLQDQQVITVGRVILTPQENSGIVFVPGVATGDQFTEGQFGTMGTPSSGDDIIFVGRTELLHAAILDGGAGNDALVIEAKGSYAQPSAVVNIQTIRILNSENTTADVLAQVAGQNILTAEQVGFQIVTTFPTFIPDPAGDNSWIDLSAAFDIETLVIGENTGVTGSNLAVVGVNNGAQVVLQGGFQNSVLIGSGFNFGTSGVFNLRLEDVNFEENCDAQLIIAQNSTHLAIESTGVDLTVENFIENGNFGGNLRTLTVTGDKFLHIESAVDFNTSRPITIDASTNTGGVKLEAENADPGQSVTNNTIIVRGSQGDDYFTLEADAFNIVGGAGNNIYELTGSYDDAGITGARVILNGTAGTDTIVLEAIDKETFTLLAGSSISGANNTIVALGDTDLSNATMSGIDAIVMNGTVTVTAAQAQALGAETFSAYREAEAGAVQNLNILITSNTVLSDLLDLSALSDGVKLSFFIAEGATLTMSAEEMHLYLAEDAIDLGDGSNDTSPGSLVITGAGPNFNPSNAGSVAAPELAIDGGGTITGATNNLTVIRSADGYDRPSQQLVDDKLIIDSSAGPVEVGANDFGDDENFTIPQTNVLVMTGENDITFTAPVDFAEQPDFTIDFSGVGGTVSGLEIIDFENVEEIIGNGGARIDVQLAGNVGDADNGLITSGVATYVVTDLNDGEREFWTSNPTKDVEVLGLQGNYGNGITFGNVVAGVQFLMEVVADKFDPAYSVGSLTGMFARDGIVDAVVNVVGLQTLPAGEVQTVGGITLTNAASATINIEGGNTVIETLTGDFPALTITGDADVKVEGDFPVTLTDIDASGVVGMFTVTITNPDEDFSFLGAEGGTVLTLDGVDGENTIDGGVGGADLIIENTVDLSESALSNISSVTLTDTSDLTLTAQQALDIGMANITVEDGSATLTLNVTEDFDLDDLDLANLPDGLTLELSLQSGVELNITGDQLVALAEAGVVISDGAEAPDESGVLNITDFNQTHLVNAEGGDFATAYDAILTDLTDIGGTITLEGGNKVFVPTAYDTFFSNFAWELEGGTLGMTDPLMADGLVVNNGDIEFYFITFGASTVNGTPGVDAANYTNIGKISVTNLFTSSLLPGGFNVERIANLDSDTVVEIVPLEPIVFDGADRLLVVGGLPFAINEDGIPVNLQPVEGTDPAPVVEPGRIISFSNITGNPNKNVENVIIDFQVGGNVINSIVIGGGELPDGNAFQTLTLISGGDEVNTVNNITSTVLGTTLNNLLNVNIIADQEFDSQTITLASLDPDLDEATVTISGAENVTLKAIVAGVGVTTVTVDTSAHSGTLDITGGSPSIDASETLSFVGGEDSTVLLDTKDGEGGNLGVDGNGDLKLLDASGMAGTLALGDINNVAEGFELIGGTGVITANILNLPDDNWSLNISDAAAGSAINLGEALTLTEGSLSLETSGDPEETTLTFGAGTTLFVGDDLSLEALDNVVAGGGTTIVIAAGVTLTMTAEQAGALAAAGVEFIKETDPDGIEVDGQITAVAGNTVDGDDVPVDLSGLDLSDVDTLIVNDPDGAIAPSVLDNWPAEWDGTFLAGETEGGNVDADEFSAGQLSSLASFITLVDDITNLTVTSEQTAEEIAALLSKATDATVDLTDMEPDQLAAALAEIDNIDAVTGETTAAVLNSLNAAKPITLDATDVTEVSGTIAELTALKAATEVPIEVTLDNPDVMVTDPDGTAFSATDLEALFYGFTTGTISFENAVVISGTVVEVEDLIDLSSVPDLGSAVVNLTDPDGTVITALQLGAIAAATTGLVTVVNAAEIVGEVADMTAALVTAGVVAATSDLRIIEVENVTTETEQNAIAQIAGTTSGTVTVQGTNGTNTLNFTDYTGGDLIIESSGGARDTITFNSGTNTIGLDNDNLFINGGTNAIDAEAGNSPLTITAGTNTVSVNSTGITSVVATGGTTTVTIVTDAGAKVDARESTVGIIINSGDGNDIIRVGQGDDTVVLSTEDTSQDTLVFEGSFGSDTVTNFVAFSEIAAVKEVASFDVASANFTGGGSRLEYTITNGIDGENLVVEIGGNLGAQTSTQVAGLLETAINADHDSLYVASADNGTITLTAKVAGALTDIGVSGPVNTSAGTNNATGGAVSNLTIDAQGQDAQLGDPGYDFLDFTSYGATGEEFGSAFDTPGSINIGSQSTEAAILGLYADAGASEHIFISVSGSGNDIGTVWHIVDGDGSDDLTATEVGVIDLSGTSWNDLTAENFVPSAII